MLIRVSYNSIVRKNSMPIIHIDKVLMPLIYKELFYINNIKKNPNGTQDRVCKRKRPKNMKVF